MADVMTLFQHGKLAILVLSAFVMGCDYRGSAETSEVALCIKAQLEVFAAESIVEEVEALARKSEIKKTELTTAIIDRVKEKKVKELEEKIKDAQEQSWRDAPAVEDIPIFISEEEVLWPHWWEHSTRHWDAETMNHFLKQVIEPELTPEEAESLQEFQKRENEISKKLDKAKFVVANKRAEAEARLVCLRAAAGG